MIRALRQSREIERVRKVEFFADLRALSRLA